ncbi:UBX10 protein, partial [Turnix velox]|nr:UBX10 protein [Turnix velox]
MATVALLNLAPSHHNIPSSSTATSLGTNSTKMHVTRPKSAKGRTRPSFSYSQGVETCPCGVPPSRVPPSLPPAPPQGSVKSQRTSSTKVAFPFRQVSPEEIPQLLQQVPLRTSSSLNKYRVLPSIGHKNTGETEQSDHLRVREGQRDALKIKTPSGEQRSAGVLPVSEEESSHLQKPGRKMKAGSISMSTLSLQEEESLLLLAVRSPSGQRFEHHFKPTDSLQSVLAVAEQKTLAKYKHCCVETMEVPRRSFSDLRKSLQECGILHKSLLCIRHQEQPHADL